MEIGVRVGVGVTPEVAVGNGVGVTCAFTATVPYTIPCVNASALNV